MMMFGRRRRCYMMHDCRIVIDQIDILGRDDTANERNGHHAGDTGRNKTHRASFYKIVAFVSLS